MSRGTITANIVDLDDNPPPNPVADDRNDSYRKENAVMPVNPEKTQAAWSVWKAKWKEKWVWHSDWNWESEDHSASCEAGCTQSHGYWQDDGEYVDEGWWEFEEKHYSASLTADMHWSRMRRHRPRTAWLPKGVWCECFPECKGIEQPDIRNNSTADSSQLFPGILLRNLLAAFREN